VAEKEVPSECSLLWDRLDVLGDQGVVLKDHHEFYLEDQKTGTDDLAACHYKQTSHAHNHAVNVNHQLAEFIPGPSWRESIFKLREQPLSVSLEHRAVELVS